MSSVRAQGTPRGWGRLAGWQGRRGGPERLVGGLAWIGLAALPCAPCSYQSRSSPGCTSHASWPGVLSSTGSLVRSSTSSPGIESTCLSNI